MEAVEVESVLNLVPELLDVPYSRIWTAYDKEADVLYLNFKKPSHADDSELTDDDLIIRYEKGAVIGITVLNASRRGLDMGAGYDRADLDQYLFGDSLKSKPCWVLDTLETPSEMVQ